MSHHQIARGMFDGDDIVRLNGEVRGLIREELNSASLKKIRLNSFLDNPNQSISSTGNALLKMFWKSRIPRIFSETFLDVPLLLLNICTLRYQRPAEDLNYVPWHLDANFFGFGAPFLTAWVPFHEVGRRSPGLELCLPTSDIDDATIAERWRQVAPDQLGNIALDTNDIPLLFGDVSARTEAPVLMPGDALLFDQHVLHRTQVLPAADRNRLAIEFRITSKSRFPHDVDFATVRNNRVSYLDPVGRRIVVSTLAQVFAEPGSSTTAPMAGCGAASPTSG